MSRPPCVLALETSTPTARVALVEESGRVVAARGADGPRFSDALLPRVDDCLREAGLAPADLAAIACGAGPGHFTGLRVGLALAKGLALPSERPLLLVSSLAALAYDLASVAAEGSLVPCLDAGKGEVYAARATGARTLGEVWRETPEALVRRLSARRTPHVVGGPGVARHAAAFAALAAPALRLAAVDGPRAESVAALAWARLARGERDSLDAALPDYGRAPDITRPR
jgi:tRNA threonylcarbamoyladenosine biosynthesis protein TsaB